MYSENALNSLLCQTASFSAVRVPAPSEIADQITLLLLLDVEHFFDRPPRRIWAFLEDEAHFVTQKHGNEQMLEKIPNKSIHEIGFFSWTKAHVDFKRLATVRVRCFWNWN
jgi:hypothetical protein